MARSAENEHPVKALGWAARDSSGLLSPFKFSRRVPGEKDVTFKVLYCGICQSDLLNVKNDCGFTSYPVVPGHEIVGVITEVGTKVTKFKVEDRVGVGYMIGSCRNCPSCGDDLENYCPEVVLVYGNKFSHDSDGNCNYGGFSNVMVADEHFVFKFPNKMPLDGGAPLLCAGITVYSPLRYYGLDKPGMHLGVVGLGGLGHLAVKFAKAMGLKVTVISTSLSIKEEAVNHLGADAFLVSGDAEEMQSVMGTMDGIIDTVSAVHALILPLIDLLKTHGKLVMLGVPNKPVELLGRKIVGGSVSGVIKETQKMIDFAAEHSITADIEVIPMDYVNVAMDRLAKGDVRYQFVIDIANSLKSY